MLRYAATVCAISATGATTMLAIWEFHLHKDISESIVAAAVGAGLAGLVTAPLFSRSGEDGFAYWLVGALSATYLGAAAGALVSGDFVGTLRPVDILGTVPFFVFTLIVAKPLVGLTWCLGMLLSRFIATGSFYP